MASIKELDQILPAHYTMSNKNLIITAHVGEETAYFYNQLGSLSTVIVLTKPSCYNEQKIFLNLMNDLGSTAITLGEDIDFDPDYKLAQRSQNIIGNLIQNYSFKNIIIHPKYSRDNDPQNREIHDFVRQIVAKSGDRLKNKLYTYNTIGQLDKPNTLCDIQKGIIELYTKNNTKKNTRFISIASSVSGIRLLRDRDDEI